jgi:hypothetical protein
MLIGVFDQAGKFLRVIIAFMRETKSVINESFCRLTRNNAAVISYQEKR